MQIVTKKLQKPWYNKVLHTNSYFVADHILSY